MNPKVKEFPNKKCLTNSEAKRSVYQTINRTIYHRNKKSLYQKGLSSTTNNYQLAKMPNQNILCNLLLNLLLHTSELNCINRPESLTIIYPATFY